MHIHRRLAAPAALAALVLAGLVGAPTAAAGCNDSSGTTVCAQGDIRGTNGPPPAQPTRGAWGSWCSGGTCFNDYGGFGVSIGP